MQRIGRGWWRLLLAGLVGAGLGAPAAAAGAARPNIFLLTIDTIRADGLGCGGYSRPVSPFLDSLAAGGCLYTGALSTSSWTVPGVTSMLTGLYPASHAVTHGAVAAGVVADQEVVPASVSMLAEELRKLGYRTYGITANTHLMPEMGYGRGFDRYLCLGFKPGEAANEAALKWKEIIPAGDKPWFLWVHYFDPHHPYEQRAPWFGQFAGRVTSADGQLLLSARKSPPRPPRPGDPRRPRFLELCRALYDSEVRYTDEKIRQLYRDLPFLFDALLIVAGDHGEEFLEHGGTIHCRTLYGESVQVPLFVRWPDGRHAGRSSAPASLIDIPPTLVEAAGGKPPAAWSGRSLLDPAALAARPARPILAQLERNREYGLLQSLQYEGWKLIVNQARQKVELYDLTTDPAEQHDLTTTEPARAQALQTRLDDLLKSLPPPPTVVERRPLTKEAQIELKGQGYIH